MEYIAAVLVGVVVLVLRWGLEHRRRAAELQTRVNDLQALARAMLNTIEEYRRFARRIR